MGGVDEKLGLAAVKYCLWTGSVAHFISLNYEILRINYEFRSPKVALTE